MNFMPPQPVLLLLPLLAALGGLLAFGHAVAPASRHYALGASLAISLLVALLTFLHQFGGPQHIEGMLHYVSLGIFMAQIVGAALLDRARLIGLVGGAVLASYALLHLMTDALPMLLRALPNESWMLCALLAACIVGLVGSALLPAHPARVLRHGQRRAPAFTPARAAGLLIVAAAFTLMAFAYGDALPSMGFALSAITAALCPLVLGRGPLQLHRAAEGVLAGSLIAIMSGGGGVEGIAYGLLAALLVARGEAIAASLQLDDPARLVGTILLPAIAGMILPFAHDVSALAEALRWLGATVLLSGAVSLLWLIAMATVGLAAAPARVREGLDFL